MKLIWGLIFLFLFQACSSNEESATNEPTNQASISTNQSTAQHSAVVLEAIQVANYTYLRVKEGEAEDWIAVPTIEVKAGDTVFYANGMVMTKFESKELKRTFESILFVDRISKNAADLNVKAEPAPVVAPGNNTMPTVTNQPPPAMGSSKDSVKRNIKIELPKNAVSIADILKNPKSYEGKKIIVKGKVTKFTGGVMGKNWVHIQDGTDFKGKFEIVITTVDNLKDGDTATFEGTIVLNKDLGYGYFFEVLMEDAKLIK